MRTAAKTKAQQETCDWTIFVYYTSKVEGEARYQTPHPIRQKQGVPRTEVIDSTRASCTDGAPVHLPETTDADEFWYVHVT